MGKKKIMVIDDSAILLRTAKQLLEEKYDIQMAVSGDYALRMLQKGLPDLILLDYDMPQMNGVETLRKIRHSYGNRIPVIFLTGVNDKERIKEALEMDIAGYILKPFDKNRLLDAIGKAIQ